MPSRAAEPDIPQSYRPRRVALLWRGDRTTRREVTPHNNRFYRIFEELALVGIEAVPVVYDESFTEEVRAELMQMDGILVWVNPLQGGQTRRSLDAMLREVASAGPWVSAHPDTILAMGTKDVLVRTRHLGWGTDTYLYRSATQLRDEFPGRLVTAGPRVLKQARGNDGQGVWKVETMSSARGHHVRVAEASSDGPGEDISLDDFLARCEIHFENDGFIVDQLFQDRLVDGMVRCYVAGDTVAGFAHQYPKGLLPPGHVRPHGEKRMFAADEPMFQTLRTTMERQWIPQMISAIGLNKERLPAIWDADFLYGPKSPDGADTYVLCEINVSSVFAIPDPAAAAIAQLVLRRSQGNWSG